jgi:hypothetical protein
MNDKLSCRNVQNLETKSLLAGLQQFNPPPKERSYKRDNEVLNQIGRSLGAEQCV